MSASAQHDLICVLTDARNECRLILHYLRQSRPTRGVRKAKETARFAEQLFNEQLRIARSGRRINP